MDDYVDILIANLKVLASVPTVVDWRSEEVNWLTRVSTVSVYYGLVRRFAGIDHPSCQNTVAGVCTSDDIMHIEPVAQMERSMEFEQDRERDRSAEFGLQTCDRHIRPMQERLHRYKSHPNSKLTARSYYVLHRNVEVEISDTIP
jgi:hypothetical protein